MEFIFCLTFDLLEFVVHEFDFFFEFGDLGSFLGELFF